MSERWVIDGQNGWLNARAQYVDWERERQRLHYDGPSLNTGMDPLPILLRWLINPKILGLPRQPFTVWRHRHPGGNLSKAQLANLPDWEPIEVVGLPVDDSWADSGYRTDEQGPRVQPLPPIDAAERRLRAGAPRIGWPGLTLDGAALPAWQSADLHAYLRDLLESRLLHGIHAMLRDVPLPADHDKYVDKEQEAGNIGRLTPHLLLNNAPALMENDQTARSEWRPLGLMLVAAGSDPLAALALGFGTALPYDGNAPDVIYMVSVRQRFNNQGAEFEVADVVTPVNLPAPDPPSGLAVATLSRTRPQTLDGPQMEAIGVTWDRPLNPNSSTAPNSAYPASYAVGRFGTSGASTALLLTPRPPEVRGWLPYIARKATNAGPVLFVDHILRTTTIAGQVVPRPLRVQATYAVAAQDIFGRWSTWQTVPFEGIDERPQLPALLAVQLTPDGQVTVEFSWDWADRSPEFAELIGAFEDDPGTRLFTARVQFGGTPQPTFAGFQLLPLDQSRTPAPGWGSSQDPPPAPLQPAEVGPRFYRLTTSIALNFAGKPWRVLQVQARGQCHIHQTYINNWNISPFGPPSSTRVYDPLPPPPPTVPEAPQWASLRDPAGISRMLLTWGAVPNADGYVLYEATETTLLAALSLPGPDTSQPFTDRLAVLRTANLPALHSVFRRVQKELITSPSYEVSLPRGSNVMHFYAVTAMSANQVESPWPASSKQFIAVAAPRLVIPAAPILEAEADAAAGRPTAKVTVGLRPGPAVQQVELYRTTSDKLALSADTMGPPIAVLNVNGNALTFTDDTVTPGWQRIWYRTVAWAADDDQVGLVGARSLSSAAVSVLLPPSDPPDIHDLRVNEPGSSENEALISWAANAPVAVTPLGPHTAVLEARDAADHVTTRLEGRLDALPFVNSRADLPAANPADRKIVRVGTSPQRYYVWVPRPAADQPCKVTAKMIDPLGRIANLSADIPPLPALPEPELGPVQITTTPLSLLVAHWQMLVPVQPDPPEQYILRAVVRVPSDPAAQPLTIQATLDQVPEVAEVQNLPPGQVMALFNHIARVQGTQQYFIFLHLVHPLEVSVTLVDPRGRTTTQTGAIP
jgi:hypothetical protein